MTRRVSLGASKTLTDTAIETPRVELPASEGAPGSGSGITYSESGVQWSQSGIQWDGN